MNHAVLQLRQLGTIPPVSRSDKIPRNSLKGIEVMAMTMRTFRKSLSSILITTIQTTVAIMVHTAVTDIVLIHKIDNIHDSLRIMGSIPVDFHIENMSATLKIMIRSLHFSLMLRSTMEINRNMT